MGGINAGRNKLNEEEGNLGTCYLTKQPQAHYLYFFSRQFGTMEYFAATFVIIYTKRIVICGNSFSWNIGEEENKIQFAN